MAADVGDGDARGVEAMIWQLKPQKVVDHRYWIAERLSRGLSKKGLGPHSGTSSPRLKFATCRNAETHGEETRMRE
jgi:hypothetical protein